MLHGKDSQPDPTSRTPLDRRLAETLAQIDLLTKQIAAGREQRDQAPEAWDAWIAEAEQKIEACEAQAAQLRNLKAQQTAFDTIGDTFAA